MPRLNDSTAIPCAALPMRLAAALLCLATGCGAPLPAPGGFVVTIHPLALILREIAGPDVPVAELLAPGASPHTYELSARDAAIAAGGCALVYVDAALDGWAAALQAPAHIRVLDFLPEADRLHTAPELHGADDAGDHHHGPEDPHFWVSPAAVKTVLPGLTGAMAAADPVHAADYRARAARFAEELDRLDAEFKMLFADRAGKVVAQAHPSWAYLAARYGLKNAAYIEPAPGREGSARYLEAVIAQVRASGASAIITERQTAQRPAEVVAEATGVPLIELDPLASQAGPEEGYAVWLRSQAQRLHATL